MRSVTYTREAFDQQRAAAKKIERDDLRLLAAFTVPFGLGQLLLIAWLDGRMGRKEATPIEGIVFLAYMAITIALIVRMVLRARAARLKCPSCGAAIEGLSERMAVTTGRCDQCGAMVVEPPV